MRRIIEKGKTLLVDGPACLILLKGKTKILGNPLKIGERLIIREGKSLPFEVERKAAFELTLGEDGSFEETDGNTTPASWETASEEALSHGKPVTVEVIGGADSGKTSFCVYLANKALKQGRKVTIIDADLGQSDIGPPATIGFSHVTTPLNDLFELEIENAYFMGVTSPSGAVDSVLDVLKTVKKWVLETDFDLLIVNTDGWIDGEAATGYKVQTVEMLTPNITVGIQQGEELTPILSALKETKVFSVESPKVVQKKSRQRRKTLRELSYKKYLKEAKMQTFPLNWIEVTDPLGKKIKLETAVLKEGLLIALQDEHGKFLGIGVSSGIDYRRRMLKVYTSVSKKVSTICVGEVIIDKKGRELDLNSVFAD